MTGPPGIRHNSNVRLRILQIETRFAKDGTAVYAW
jgi:hypothetical protein